MDKTEPLTGMLHAASRADLIELLKKIAGEDLAIRRRCIDHLCRKEWNFAFIDFM